MYGDEMVEVTHTPINGKGSYVNNTMYGHPRNLFYTYLKMNHMNDTGS